MTTQTNDWEFRPWGSYLVVYTAPDVTVKRLWVRPKAALSLQVHALRDEFWTPTDLMTTKLTFQIGEKALTAQEQVTYSVPRGTSHRIVNDSNLGCEVIEVIRGVYDEDDIVRLDDRYGR